MGREIRRVPPSWQHPIRDENKSRSFIPLYDKEYESEANDWMKNAILWSNGTHPDQAKEVARKYKFYWDWSDAPPEQELCREYKDSDATWYQVYETVSEGTPVTPPFATKEELINYLVNEGDFWQQNDFKEGIIKSIGYSIEAAEKFVKSGWAPSIVFDGGVIKQGIGCCEDFK